MTIDDCHELSQRAIRHWALSTDSFYCRGLKNTAGYTARFHNKLLEVYFCGVVIFAHELKENDPNGGRVVVTRLEQATDLLFMLRQAQILDDIAGDP